MMKIVDLTSNFKKQYCVCLDDWSDEMQLGAEAKCGWYDAMKDHGLRVKLALDEDDQVRGMIQYSPIEYCAAKGRQFILHSLYLGSWT